MRSKLFWLRLVVCFAFLPASLVEAGPIELDELPQLKEYEPLALALNDSSNHYPVSVIVNRRVSEEDKRSGSSGKQVIPATYEQLMEYHHPADDRLREERLTQIKNFIRPLHLENRPFSIEFIEDKAGRTFSDITITTPAGVQVLRLKSAEAPVARPLLKSSSPQSIAKISWDQVKERIAKKTTYGDVFKTAMIWTLHTPADQLVCAINPSEGNFAFKEENMKDAFRAIHIEFLKDFGKDEVQQGFAEAVRSLGRQERFTAFTRRKSDNPCLKGISDALWKHMMMVDDSRVALLEDFHYWMDDVLQFRNKLTFSNEIEGHIIADDALHLETKLLFLQELLISMRPSEFSAVLPREYREGLTWDTNGVSNASRTEPIDILAFFSSRNHFPELVKGTNHDLASRNSLSKAAIQHKLVSERFPARVMIRRSDEPHTKELGHEAFYIYCAGGRIFSPDNRVRSKGSALTDYIELADSDLRNLKAANGKIPFTCDGMTATLAITVEPLQVPLQDPTNAHFKLGDDRKIKSIVTIEFVDKLDPQYLFLLKTSIGVKGYQLVSEEQVGDLKTDFLRELGDTDFYFPANFEAFGGAGFPVGYDGSPKLRFQKRLDGKTSELVVYVPPRYHGNSRVVIGDEELIALFKQRREAETARRLTVMNIKCNSVQCVDYWMRRYKNSLNGVTNNLMSRIDEEVPIVIGANRTFNVDTFAALFGHSQYPFETMDLALQERTGRELISKLTADGFQPYTSMGQNFFYDVVAQNNRLTLLIELASGEKVVY